MELDTVRKTSFKPASRRSSHLRLSAPPPLRASNRLMRDVLVDLGMLA